MKGTAKQSVMVAIIVVCLILAIIITIKTRPDTSTGIPKEFAGQMMWLKCTDANCGAEYQTDKKSYYEYMEENRGTVEPNRLPMADLTLLPIHAMACKECEEKSVYKAIECSNEECGVIFKAWSAGMGDYEDRCPECGISQMEEEAKKIREKHKVVEQE